MPTANGKERLHVPVAYGVLIPSIAFPCNCLTDENILMVKLS